MDCKYSYYDGDKDSFNMQYKYCSISKQMCHAIRRCSTLGRIINTDNYTICPLYTKQKELIGYSELTPDKVVIEKNGTLWVNHHELDQVFTIKNPYDYIPTYVKLIKKENELGEYSIEEARN